MDTTSTATERTGTPPRRSPARRDLEQLAQQLIERAEQEGLELVGPNGLLAGVTKHVVETALETEMTGHLGYGPHERSAGTNARSAKTIHTDVGPVHIEIPRDRAGTFEPKIVPKHARRLDGFDEAIISLYAKGLTTGEIQAHLSEIYGADVSRETISKVTDAVATELAEWQNRPLDSLWPVIFIDAVVVKIRDGAVANRPVYVACGI